MRTPAPEQKQKETDLLGWRSEQRFELRRQAARRRGVNFQERSVHAASTRHLPTPLLFMIVVGSSGVFFVLAVIGTYALIRAVVGR